MKKTLIVSLIMMLSLAGLVAGGKSDTAEPEVAAVTTPKYVFYMIGDGMGAAQRQVAEYYLQHKTGDASAHLAMNTLPVSGINTTHSSSSLITDSAAAGTALAAGYKTDNGMIAVTPDGNPVKTLVEVAEEKGMATGLISTTRLTHATPAAFASHNPDRGDENGIALDFVDSGVDFFAGGGIRYFVSDTDPQKYGETDAVGATIKSKRKDGKDLVAMFADQGYNTFIGAQGADAFAAYAPQGEEQVFAAFTYTHTPYEIDRINTENNSPSLADMTAKGVEVLSQYEKGFFLMVEGGRIDHACHANDAAGAIYDTFAFDNAIKVALDFYEAHPEETAIVVVGDHETGGMGLGFGADYFLDFSQLDEVKVSVEDTLRNVYGDVEGDRDAFFAYIAENCGLDDLTEEETAAIVAAMDHMDAGEEFIKEYYTEVAIAVTHIIAERVNMYFTTYAHSGTSIPMSAIGEGTEMVGGFKDNTEIAMALSDLTGLALK
ncbi:MAG: alkaline phosphatase [Spirochaetales bacterium]|nr:alkaline phosphatase [Spirochaetales bacterium]